MEQPTPGGVPKFRWATRLAGGYLIFLFLLLIAFALFIILGHRQELSSMAGFPTPVRTATSIPTPQILVRAPSDPGSIRFEDFQSDVRDWSLYYPNGKVQTVNGKLILQSYTRDEPVMAYERQFIPAGSPYYVQADFTTDRNADRPYGLVFGFDQSLDTYYAFEILPQFRQFTLIKHSVEKWNPVVPSSFGEMRPYPAVNTLSAYVDGGRIQVYINGTSVASYTDPQPYPSGDVGVYVGDSACQLIVDNFFAYSEK